MKSIPRGEAMAGKGGVSERTNMIIIVRDGGGVEVDSDNKLAGFGGGMPEVLNFPPHFGVSTKLYLLMNAIGVSGDKGVMGGCDSHPVAPMSPVQNLGTFRKECTRLRLWVRIVPMLSNSSPIKSRPVYSFLYHNGSIAVTLFSEL